MSSRIVGSSEMTSTRSGGRNDPSSTGGVAASASMRNSSTGRTGVTWNCWTSLDTRGADAQEVRSVRNRSATPRIDRIGIFYAGIPTAPHDGVVIIIALLAAASIAAKAHATTPRDVLHDLAHERVDYWVFQFSKDHDYHKKIAEGLVRKPKYEKMIERKLRAPGMPRNLIYLAMDESAFNAEAASREKAVGIWQLTAATARLYGLTVTKKRDDRRTGVKEADAA